MKSDTVKLLDDLNELKMCSDLKDDHWKSLLLDLKHEGEEIANQVFSELNFTEDTPMKDILSKLDKIQAITLSKVRERTEEIYEEKRAENKKESVIGVSS